MFLSDFGVFVRDGDGQSPLAVFVDDFGSSDPPVIVFECGLDAVEVVCTPMEFAFDMCPACRSDTEPYAVTVLVGEQAGAFRLGS